MKDFELKLISELRARKDGKERMDHEASSAFLKKRKPKALNYLPSVLFRKKRQGPVVQTGMNAAFAMRKSWVQIPPGPL